MLRVQALRSIFLMLFLSITLLSAQAPQGRAAGRGNFPASSLSGRVLDLSSGSPVQYANIMLHHQSSEEAVTGTISNELGRFNISPIRPGLYYVTIKFMGFEELRVDSVAITFAVPEVDLGEINIVPATVAGESVVIERERTTMEYKIDKKVINVGQDLTSSSGSAVEVLENAPSVTVDIEGNVSLRGSQNFTVLVDNRPSILEANEALQTIPASTIDNIEIITNPSAAYDPDGVSGIINIITKKSKLSGISGIANFNAGMLGQVGGDILVNYRNDKLTAYVSAAYNVRGHEGQDTSFNATTLGDTTFYVSQLGDRRFEMAFGRIRLGLDYNLTEKDVFGLNISYGSRGFKITSNNAFQESTNLLAVPFETTTEALSDRGGYYSGINANYEHRFGLPTHRLEANLRYSLRGSDEESITEQFDSNGAQVSGRQTTENGPTSRGRFELKYEQPFANDGKLEGGYQLRTGTSSDESGLKIWQQNTDSYLDVSDSQYDTEYLRTIQSIYGVGSNNFGKLGVQLGFRSEYTYRKISLAPSHGMLPDSMDSEFTIDRWDYFPSVHLSYNITPTQKFMSSYSRRIDRPRGWFLEPFLTWSDAYNVRSGNPALKPEYINSMEFGYMQYFGKNMISLEVYSRETTNLIEHVQSVYAGNIFLHSFQNVGNSLSVGSELSLRVNAFKWWDFNLMGNVYHYEINDQPEGLNQNIESDNWSLRFNHNFTVNKMIKLQLNAMYNSPSATAQGERDAMFFLNAGARLNLIDNKLSATINVRDILDTGDHEFTTQGPDFYSYHSSNRVAPIISASIKYNFNNYKSRDMMNGDAMNGGEGSAEGDDF